MKKSMSISEKSVKGIMAELHMMVLQIKNSVALNEDDV
jgi:hypothetical protein